MRSGNRRLSKRTVSTIPHGTLRAHAANRSSSVPKTHPAPSAPDVQGESHPALSFDAMSEERPGHAGRIDAVLRAHRVYGGAPRTRRADQRMRRSCDRNARDAPAAQGGSGRRDVDRASFGSRPIDRGGKRPEVQRLRPPGSRQRPASPRHSAAPRRGRRSSCRGTARHRERSANRTSG